MPGIGILVLDRLELMRQVVRLAVRPTQQPAVDMTMKEVFLRYRGFDGEWWPDAGDQAFAKDGGLAAPADLAAIESYVGRLPQRNECDLILLAEAGADLESVKQSGWSILGFDVGYCESKWSHYSLVLNEVIFGSHDETRQFAGRLNEHLLLPRHEDAARLMETHNRLASEGKEVEEAEHLEPIEIFAR